MRCAHRQRSAGRCGAGGATLPPARPRAAALVDRGDAAGSCDPSDPPALRGDSAPPTYEQCAGIRLRPRQRPLAPVRYLSDGQFALDHAASDGHSCGCSSGPPGFLKPRQLQLPRSRPDGQPIESSHLALDLLGVPHHAIPAYRGLKEVETAILQNIGQLANSSLSGWSGSVEPTMGDIVTPLWQLSPR